MGTLEEEEVEEEKEEEEGPAAEAEAAAEARPRRNVLRDGAKACSHEVVWPDPDRTDSPVPGARPGPPAKEYAFPLDPFQRASCNILEQGDSVLVSAHTSAGKTVVAEYAIAMALRDKQRVVYTSPLKALSNQKYRELAEEFQDVGLMTGDVTINEDASCLVMTTEILRSMLYAGSEVVREVAWVIFDEIHYLRDKERGVVWEETIILVPDRVRFVFLSATIPNAREFAGWVAKTHRQPCHVVYTDYRPTPLQHYLFPAGGDGLFLVVDGLGGGASTFKQGNFQKAVAAMGAEAEAARYGGKARKDTESDIYKIVKMIMERGYDPVIVFSFSKKDCERLALDMSTLDLIEEDEKRLVDGIFANAMECLSDEDRRLPQIQRMLPLLKRGIGVHHSGLLPILKETIEILFQEGLLKCLFATETFSTGLNMPAKTVVFTSPRKFDGGGFRWVTGGEYIQMSGRAGRRGLDDKGIVILMMDAKMEPAIVRGMVQGAPDPLYSSFHLSYNMIVNLLRTDGEPQALIRQSYRQFQTDRSLPAMERHALALEKQAQALEREDEGALEEFVHLLGHLSRLRGDLRAHLQAADVCVPFLQPGRLAKVLCHSAGSAAGARDGEDGEPVHALDRDRAVWGVVADCKQLARSKKGQRAEARAVVIDVLVACDPETVLGGGKRKHDRREPLPVPAETPGARAVVLTVPVERLDGLSTVRIFLPKNLKVAGERDKVTRAVAEVRRRFADKGQDVPLLGPPALKLDAAAHAKAEQKVAAVDGTVQRHPLCGAEGLDERITRFQRRHALLTEAAQARKEAKAAATMVAKDELKGRLRLLRRLGLLDKEGIVQLKGHIAAEVASADELVLTEMVFNGTFKDLTTEQIVALLSCFVWSEKLDKSTAPAKDGKPVSEPRLPDDLAAPFRAVREAVKKVGQAAVECKVEADLAAYVDSFRHELMEAAAAWTAGAKFAAVVKKCDTFEGSLVRAFRRLEELLRQLITATQKIGEHDMAAKFEEASRCIKRDVVFAASLYL